jgi:hypothetical protein
MRTLEEVARELAAAHRSSDPATTTIKLFPSNGTDEIRLLEISSLAPTTGEVLPFRFGPSPRHNIHYPSIIILLSPQEWQDVQHGHLALPEGWNLSLAKDL